MDAAPGFGGKTMETLEKFGGQTPLGRPGPPAELGSIYVQLAGEDASFATGQVYGAVQTLDLPQLLSCVSTAGTGGTERVFISPKALS
jgi:hypothetical protein